MLQLHANATSASIHSSLCGTAAQTRDELIMEHLPQVRLIARRIHHTLPGNVNLEDLVSSGVVGLIGAIDRFDASLNVKLKTYAEFKIRGAIIDSLRTADWASRPQRRRARMIATAMADLEARLQRTPTEDEIAEALEVSVDEYRDWSADTHGLHIGSLEATNSSEDGRDLLQTIPDQSESLPSELLENAELRKLVALAVSRMPQTERKVLELYYHQEKTLKEIAKVMNLHESRISQLKTQAISRLRTFLASKWPERGAAMPSAA